MEDGTELEDWLFIAQVLSLEVIGNEYMLRDFVSTAFD